MKSVSRISLARLLTGSFAVALLATPARGDVIMDCNAKADAIAIEKQIANAPNARGQAMLHVAMFEAVNAIDRRYAPYRLNLVADRGTSREAAAATAAHDVLVALYPDQKPDLDAMLAARGRKIDIVLELKVNDKVLLDRVEQRIKEGGVLRSDDTPETLRHRLGVYYKNTAPLLDYYGKQDKVVTIDGMASIAEVTTKIGAALDQKR